MGDVYSIFSHPLVGGAGYFFCWLCVLLLVVRKDTILEAVAEWVYRHKILSVGVLLLCLSVSIFSNRSFYRWIDCTDLRTMPAGEYCYYVKVNRELDDRVYTLPAKIEVARSGYTYTTGDGKERTRSESGYYLRTVYFNNGGYLMADKEFEVGKAFGFVDQDYEGWDCTVTDQRCTPATFTESSAPTDRDTGRLTFCVMVLVLTYISLRSHGRDAAEEERKRSNLPNFNVCFSVFGDHYHSTDTCNRLRGEIICWATDTYDMEQLYKRRPCPKCCTRIDGKVYPIDPETAT